MVEAAQRGKGLNATGVFTLKCLILCYVSFTRIFFKKNKVIRSKAPFVPGTMPEGEEEERKALALGGLRCTGGSGQVRPRAVAVAEACRDAQGGLGERSSTNVM